MKIRNRLLVCHFTKPPFGNYWQHWFSLTKLTIVTNREKYDPLNDLPHKNDLEMRGMRVGITRDYPKIT
jgi:hypothetical protein